MALMDRSRGQRTLERDILRVYGSQDWTTIHLEENREGRALRFLRWCVNMTLGDGFEPSAMIDILQDVGWALDTTTSS